MSSRAQKKRASVVLGTSSTAGLGELGLPTDRLVGRVRECLDELGDFSHLRVRSYGQHILIEPNAGEHTRDRDAIARLTALGRDAFGLSFRRRNGGWEPIVLIDTLDEIVADMTLAMASEQDESAQSNAA